MMALVGIVLAGSRTVWLVAGLVVGYEILRKIGSSLGSLRSLSCLIIVVIGGVFLVGNSGGWDKESYGKRMELNKAGWEMIKSNPLLGVGAGNFVVELPEYQKNGILWLQPVHNIFLLGLAEIGILGVMVILWAAKSLGLLKRLMLRESWWIVGVVVLTGIVDHYWLTLPQNSWLCAIVMAII
jgi:O-antigen ligase